MEIITREYEGIEIYFSSETNLNIYLNATKTAKNFGKKPDDWLRTDQTKKYIKAVSDRFANMRNDLVIVKQGGKAEEQGTWIHKKLIIAFARWLSPDFAVWCDEIIEEVLKTGNYSISQLPNFSEIISQNEEALKLIELLKSSSSFDLLLLQKLLKENSVSSLFQLDFSQTYFLPTELGKLHGISGRETNLLLEKRGFQEKQGEVWKLTESGKDFGIEVGGAYHQLKWKLETQL